MTKKELKQLLKKAVNILLKKANYADALFIETSSFSIAKDKTSIDISNDAEKGIKLRAFDGEKFLEFGTSNIDENNVLKNAELLSKKITKKNNSTFEDEKIEKDFKTKEKINPTTISSKDKVKAVDRIFKKIQDYDKRIINTKVVYDENVEKKIFVSRNKTLSQEISCCTLVIMPFVQTPNNEIRSHFESFFANGFEATKIPDKKLKEIAEMAVRIIDAEKIKPGKYMAILHPHVTGLLAHESFGHGMESDTIYKERAKASKYIGKRIANDIVSIADNPTINSNGFYFFDDEGRIAEMTYLVKDGIVQHPITEMYSAKKLGIKRTGNGRLESFDHKAYARMSTTYFMQGKSQLKDMIKNVKEGIFLHYGSGGMEDPKGWGVQIQGNVGERIHNGKLTGELYYEVGISGYLPEILSNIVEVSKEFKAEGTGMCGKGHKEWVRVSDGGPYLKINELELA